jgi:uncharacterized protein (TIGR02722 family)
MKNLLIFLSIVGLLIASGCRPSQKVTRISPNTQTDLSGKWNDTDARKVAEDMIADIVSKPWLSQFNKKHVESPVVIVGHVRNETMEHIDTEVFTKEMERAFVNTGKVAIVADSEQREAIRDERYDQQTHASDATTKQLGKELGADYMLVGSINSIVDESVSGKEVAVFYTVNLELVSIESNQKVWLGNKKIKKFIERRNFRG